MVSRDFPPLVGGVASHIFELSREFVHQGHEVHVLTRKLATRFDGDRVLTGVHRIPTPMWDIPHTQSLQLLFQFSYWLWHLHRKLHFDVVHCHRFYPDVVTTKVVGQTPVVFTNHTSGFLRRSANSRAHWRLRCQLSHVWKVIGPSEELVQRTIDVGVPAERVVYIPNGVDPERFSPTVSGEAVRARYGFAQDHLVVLSPRRLASKNGVMYLARTVASVASIVPEAQFVFVGDGPEKEDIVRVLNERGGDSHARLVGSVPNSEMPSYFAAADVVVIPSLMEATSIAGLEAMASGKPLVGTRVGGIPAIIGDGVTGLLVEPASSSALGDALVTLLQDGTRRKAMGQAARARVLQNFSWEAIARRTLEVYESVVTSKMGNP